MKRQASVPMQVLELGPYQYTTLDLAPPDRNYGCCYGGSGCFQRAWITIPPGWELAPAEDNTVTALRSYSWGGATRIIFANGNSYPSGTHAIAGEVMHDMLQSQIIGLERECKPKKAAGEARIMIRKRVYTSAVPETQCDNDTIVGQMWKKRRFTDFTIRCAGQEMPCHRAVLAEGSLVLEAALTGNMREASEGRLEIEDAEPDAVEGMLSFLYNGKLDERAADPAYLTKLVALADRYGMKGLAQASQHKLLNSLDPSNVVMVTRALKSTKENPEVAPLWKELQARLRTDDKLLNAVLSDI